MQIYLSQIKVSVQLLFIDFQFSALKTNINMPFWVRHLHKAFLEITTIFLLLLKSEKITTANLSPMSFFQKSQTR